MSLSRRRRLLPLLVALAAALSITRHAAADTPSTTDLLREAEGLDAAIAGLSAGGRYAEAEALARRALAIREEMLGERHPATARSRNDLGDLLRELGDLEGARPHLERALAIRKDVLGIRHPDTAQSLNDLGVLLQELGDLEGSRPNLEEALAIREEVLGPRHPDTAESLTSLGVLLFYAADRDGAKRSFERALTIREEALGAEHPETIEILNNLGVLLQEMGDIVGARPYLERALAARTKTLGPGHPETAQSLHNLGVLSWTMGSLDKARSRMEHALAIREEALGPTHVDTGQSLNDLGALLQEMDELESARSYYERSLAICEQTLGRDHPDTATALSNLGVLLWAMGNLDAARPYLERSLAIWERTLGPDHPETAFALGNLGELLQATGDLEGARGHLERALEICESALGREHPDTVAILHLLSTLSAAAGDYERAVELELLALEAEESLLADTLAIGSDQEKQMTLSMLEDSSHAVVSLHVHSAPDLQSAARLALSTILRRKARALDAGAENLRLMRANAPGEHRELFDTLTELREKRAHLLLNPPDDLTAPERFEHRQALAEQIEQAETALSMASLPFRAARTAATMESVQARIPEDSALVEFFVYRPSDPSKDEFERWGEPRYAGYVLRRSGEPRSVALGSATVLDAAAHSLRASLARRGQDVLTLARELDQLTMAKVRPLLGNSTESLILSPDGVLNLVPFAALVTEEGDYLVEHYRLSYVTSGRDLLRQDLPLGDQQAPLLVGDPDFGGQPGPVAERGGTAYAQGMWPPTVVDLPGTATEVQLIGELLGLDSARVLTRNRATERAVKAVRGPAILHLATHGFFLTDAAGSQAPGQIVEEPDTGEDSGAVAGDTLLRSALALSGYNRRLQADDANDGLLTALEVLSLDLWGTEVVTLSACETGLGEVRSGEGVLGLRRALVLAGARSQVMSLWRVADEPTQRLMVSWYSQLKKGMGRAEALRRIQLAALRDEQLPYAKAGLLGRGLELLEDHEPMLEPRIAGSRHPYYWASFIVIGQTGPLDYLGSDG